MSFANSASRFAFLVDDAPDPFETAKKKGSKGKADQNGPGKKNNAGGNSKASNKKQSPTAKSNAKELQNMAFGAGPSEGKKKKAGLKKETAADILNNMGGGDTILRDARTRPEGVTEAQWQEWQKRDFDYVSGTYESDLEAALLQSKLDFQSEQTRLKTEAQAKTKTKKKPVSVPLSEFNAMLSQGKPLLHAQSGGMWPGGTVSNGLPSCFENEDELKERFRIETQLEIERQRQIGIEREMLLSRNQQQVLQQQVPVETPGTVEMNQRAQEKDILITSLTAEKLELHTELETIKSRFKKLCSVLSDAQLKEKAVLVAEVEKLSRLNIDLNEEVNSLHSQLEQEKSKSHSAMIEYRKLVEQTRRRTNADISQ